MSIVLLLVVVVGFTRTFFLRFFFDVPPVPVYVHVHGAILTGWLVWFVVQSSTVAAGRVKLHRRLGWIGAVLGLATIFSTWAVQIGFISRSAAVVAAGNLPILVLSRVVWGNYGSLLSFTIFLVWGVVSRRRPDVHKRAMYLASVSLIGPAVVRAGRFPVFGGTLDLRYAIGALVILSAALVFYDVSTLKRVHRATIVGCTFRVLLAVGSFAFGGTEIAQAWLRDWM